MSTHIARARVPSQGLTLASYPGWTQRLDTDLPRTAAMRMHTEDREMAHQVCVCVCVWLPTRTHLSSVSRNAAHRPLIACTSKSPKSSTTGSSTVRRDLQTLSKNCARLVLRADCVQRSNW